MSAAAAAAAAMRLSMAHQTRFALCLYAALASSPSATPPSNSSNAVFSPLSIHVALGLLAAGSGGATRDQLVAVLAGGGGGADGLHALGEEVAKIVLADGAEAGGPRIAFADAVFVDASVKLKPAFEQVAVEKYNAEILSVDFQKKPAQVADQVNSWVEKVTSGLIKDLLPPGSVDEATRLILANALYFKGALTEKFDASETRDSDFHLLDGSSVRAPFMSSIDYQYLASYNHFKVLKLPYQQGGDERQFSMYIFLPEAQDGLWSLAEKLSSEPEFLDKHIPASKIPIGQMKVPKFKISYGFEASKLLKGLGLGLPFSTEADFSEFVDAPVREKLSVSSIIHKSFIEVNEGGTEAAAASAIEFEGSACCSPLRKTTDFIADHPFLFLVREDMSGVVLFVGHVASQVADQVNLWVEKVTSGLIKDLLPPGSVDEATRLIIANALYFKGVWTEKFDASETRDSDFHLLDGSSVRAPFMSSRDDQYIASYNHFKVLKLSYQLQQGGDERQFSTYIVLPEAQDGLWSLVEKLRSEPEFFDKHIPVSKIPVGQIKVPKFKISYGFEASELLKGMGLGLPFSAEADLSEFVDAPIREKLYVSSIFHKSFVEVNEGGTEAAAASAIGFSGSACCSPLRKTTNFIADHPFLFLVREDTSGVVLFVGHVVNPLLAP